MQPANQGILFWVFVERSVLDDESWGPHLPHPDARELTPVYAVFPPRGDRPARLLVAGLSYEGEAPLLVTVSASRCQPLLKADPRFTRWCARCTSAISPYKPEASYLDENGMEWHESWHEDGMDELCWPCLRSKARELKKDGITIRLGVAQTQDAPD